MQIGAEIITYLGPVPITNTVTTTILLDIILIILAIVIRSKLSIIPGIAQGIFELIHDFVDDLTKNVVKSQYIKPVFPWILSFFVIILISNWMGLLPGIETIYLKKESTNTAISEVKLNDGEAVAESEHIPLFRGANADLNTTLALALVSFSLVNISAFYFIGIKGWFKHYFHTKPLYLIALFIFVGLLEIMLDPVKFVSLALRLFGNIYAGETLVGVMTTVPGIALPFLLLEVLVGAIQALIFTGLSLTFLGVMLSSEEEH